MSKMKCSFDSQKSLWWTFSFLLFVLFKYPRSLHRDDHHQMEEWRTHSPDWIRDEVRRWTDRYATPMGRTILRNGNQINNLQQLASFMSLHQQLREEVRTVLLCAHRGSVSYHARDDDDLETEGAVWGRLPRELLHHILLFLGCSRTYGFMSAQRWALQKDDGLPVEWRHKCLTLA